MNLNIFPDTIADLERALLKQNQLARELRDRLEEFDRAIDFAIAHDTDLRNDLQRKSKRAELMAEGVYQKALSEFRKTTEIARLIEIDLDLTKNQFTVAKLEARERIARLEGAVA